MCKYSTVRVLARRHIQSTEGCPSSQTQLWCVNWNNIFWKKVLEVEGKSMEPKVEELTGYGLDKKIGCPHPFVDPKAKQPVEEPLTSEELWWNWGSLRKNNGLDGKGDGQMLRQYFSKLWYLTKFVFSSKRFQACGGPHLF